jgi:hypothetical protein
MVFFDDESRVSALERPSFGLLWTIKTAPGRRLDNYKHPGTAPPFCDSKYAGSQMRARRDRLYLGFCLDEISHSA